MTQIILMIAVPTVPLLTFALTGMIYAQPCVPFVVGYAFIPECQSFPTSLANNILIKLIVAIPNVALSQFLLNDFILEIAGLAPVICHEISTAVKALERYVCP